jgi:hypothetical protein
MCSQFSKIVKDQAEKFYYQSVKALLRVKHNIQKDILFQTTFNQSFDQIANSQIIKSNQIADRSTWH